MATDDEKAVKMREANNALAKLLEPIGRYEYYLEAATRSQKKALDKRYPAATVKQVEAEMSGASRALGKAVDAMLDAHPASLDEAIKSAENASESAGGASARFDAILRKAAK